MELSQLDWNKKNTIWGIYFIIIALVFQIQLFQNIWKNVYPAYAKKNKQGLGKSEGE